MEALTSSAEKALRTFSGPRKPAIFAAEVDFSNSGNHGVAGPGGPTLQLAGAHAESPDQVRLPACWMIAGGQIVPASTLPQSFSTRRLQPVGRLHEGPTFAQSPEAICPQRWNELNLSNGSPHTIKRTLLLLSSLAGRWIPSCLRTNAGRRASAVQDGGRLPAVRR
jgi:hypothetical protein